MFARRALRVHRRRWESHFGALLKDLAAKRKALASEAAAADEGVLDRLAGADLAFVVDPVDGTANFASGTPLFGSMAAAVHRGEVVAAWIHDPLGDDTAMALRGEGAWIADAEGRHMTDLRVAANDVMKAWGILKNAPSGRKRSGLMSGQSSGLVQ